MSTAHLRFSTAKTEVTLTASASNDFGYVFLYTSMNDLNRLKP